MKRSAKTAMKRGLFRLSRFGSKLGIHITPRHFYSSQPDIDDLRRTQDEWRYASDLPGIHVDLDEQARNLQDMVAPFESEYRGNTAFLHGVANQYGPGYGYIEAQAIHGVVRSVKPRRIIEVGSGVSTHCMLTALALNEKDGGPAAEMTCVEPFPSSWLRDSKDIRLIPQKVQTVDTATFEELEEGDLLFIDSSHTVKPGSDVNHLFLEVLPRIKPGVYIHVHDITLPYDYGRSVLKTKLHWSETSLLRAYLTQNDHVGIVFCLSHLFYERPDMLKQVFPEFTPQPANNGLHEDHVKPFAHPEGHFPSSIYLRTR